MCLIRVRREVEDEEVIHPRLSNGHAIHSGTTTTVITPIPPAPPPPPPVTVYSDALVTTANSHGQDNYVYDVGTDRLIEAEYRNASVYDADADRRSWHRDYRASEGAIDVHGGSRYDNYDRDSRVKTTIKGSVVRSRSEAGRSRSHSHSRSRSHSGVVRATSTSKTSKPEIIISGREPYVQTHRHRHRRRSGSIEREKSVTRFSHIDSPEARRVVSGRHSHVSISNGRMSEVEMSEPRSSFRYIEPRRSARGLESAEMVRRREEERFAYGGLNPHRRSGSVSYLAAEHAGGHHRSFSGSSRRSREKVIVMDRDYY